MGEKYLWQIMELMLLSKQKILCFVHFVELGSDSIEHLMSFVLPEMGDIESLVVLELFKRSGRATMKSFPQSEHKEMLHIPRSAPFAGCESVRGRAGRGERAVGSGQKAFPVLDAHSEGCHV